jgi:hypothetical protein
VEDLSQGERAALRREAEEIRQGQRAHGAAIPSRPPKGAVVDDHGFRVRGQPDVELEDVGTHRDGCVIGRDGVLGGVGGGAAVGDRQGRLRGEHSSIPPADPLVPVAGW